MTTTHVEDIPTITREQAPGFAATELRRMGELLRSLDAEDWKAATDCTGWDVRALAGHVVGMTQTFTGFRQLARDMRAGAKRAGARPMIDGLTELQVEHNAPRSTDELLRVFDDAAPRMVRFRSRRRALRRAPLKQEMPDGSVEKWRMGYLLDKVLTRDTWMHRIDITRATGRPMVLTADHDGRIVADAVAEWASRHGKPFTLVLGGPAGGSYARGEGGEHLELDAVEFCRILSGRGTATGLLTQEVPF